jgi:hypothetical protein
MMIAWFALLGFFLDMRLGIVTGIGFSILLFMIFSFWGEKIILYFAEARYVTDDESLLNQVKNFSCHLGLRNVKIFTSVRFPNNIYYTRAYWGEPTLIIGKNIFNTLSKNELSCLIYSSLLRLKSLDACHRTMVSLILSVLLLPVYLFRRMFSKLIKSYLIIFLYPGYFLKSFMYASSDVSILLDQEVISLPGLRKEYITSIFKISKLESDSNFTAGDYLLYQLSHIPNKSRDVLFDIFEREISTTERIKVLAGF